MSAYPPFLNVGGRLLSVVPVRDPSDFENIDGSKAYFIDGPVDMLTNPIEVSEEGLTIVGFGTRVSRLISSEDNYKMFVVASGAAYSGDINFIGIDVEVSGTNSQVFDLNNDENFGAIEFESTNFTDCTSLGEITAYRQLAGFNIGNINGNEGFTLSGTMAGVVWEPAIVLLFTAPVGYVMFKAGTNLLMEGSFRTNINALNVPADFVLFDFDETHIDVDSGVQLEGVRTIADDAVPNLPSSNIKANYRNCRGIQNTYIGGNWTITSAVTTVLTQDVLTKLEGVTTYNDMVHFSSSGNNAFVYDEAGAPRSFEIIGNLSLDGNNNIEFAIQIRKWDASASAYVNVGPEFVTTTNGGVLNTRAENTGFIGDVDLEENDRIEIWIKNLINNTNVDAVIGGYVQIRER